VSELAGVGDRGAKVVGIQIGVVIEDFSRRHASAEGVENDCDVDSRTANVGAAGADLGINSHPRY